MGRRLDELDYYALLGVAPDASVDAIKLAFRTFARKYHPDRLAGEPEEQAKVVRIYRRGTEAYRVLTHFEQRRAYDQQLAQGKLRFDPEQAWQSIRPTAPPGQASDVRNSRARPFMAKAEQAMRAKDWKQARLNLQIALQHEPGNETILRKLAEVDAQLGS
ncbi:MAG TPA: DnaJ domain-containing protein [Polyangiales bacterium]|nr:DnaJ domain-containing protein [Polyangiales bacterium]